MGRQSIVLWAADSTPYSFKPTVLPCQHRAGTDSSERIGYVSHCALTPWAGLGAAIVPVEDLRRNPFDWESWHECDIFRAEVERQISR